MSNKQRDRCEGDTMDYLVDDGLVLRVEILGKRGTKDSLKNSAFFSRGSLRLRNDHCLV